MGLKDKIDNPLLKRSTVLSSKLTGSHQASKNGLLSYSSSLTKETLPKYHTLNLQSGLSSNVPLAKPYDKLSSKLKSSDGQSDGKLKQSSLTKSSQLKGPSLFSKQLVGDTVMGKTSLSLPSKKYIPQTKHESAAQSKSLTGTLGNPNLLQFDRLSNHVNQLSSLSSKTLQSRDLSGGSVSTKLYCRSGKKKEVERKEKKTKEKSKGKYEKHISVDSYIEVPTYNISLADTLAEDRFPGRWVDPAKYLKVEVDYFAEEEYDGSRVKKEKEKIDDKKVDLINLVSIALLQSPDFEDPDDATRKQLMEQVREMASIDPEFVLKLTLYTRKHLNLRIVTNFLLAYSACLHETRPFLKKYFAKCINLPTDWVKVAELYQTFFDESINSKSLPTSLRNVMVAKFPEFDEYQLGKYNKEKPKPSKVIFKPVAEDSDEELESRQLESYTLKKLVRKLHICDPVYSVMCIIGKRYPDDSQSFYQARLPGVFDETKAGQRMKLATPETWETQVSLKGNKATTWQDLLDRKKLPFMAMLRNLRNMLIAGISQKHHNSVLKRLTDQKQVINSQQFPFRFLSAYEVLEDLEAMLKESFYSARRGSQKKRGGKPIVLSTKAFDEKLLKRYKNALDTALKISTIYNIPPICGTTLIIIYYDPDADNGPCASLKNVSKQKTVIEMCLLLGLMCKFHCEDGILLLLDIKNDRFVEVGDINTDSILKNMAVVQQKLEDVSSGERDIWCYLNRLLSERKKIDILLKLGGGPHHTFTDKFLRAYRKDVNPSCLCVTVPLLGKKSETAMTGKYDVQICGFSDQILRYVAERGNGKQLATIEKIDVAYGLDEIMVSGKAKPLYIPSPGRIERPVMPWKTVRVFISSTFKDFHGERDLLTRYVFPELRCWCYNYCLNIYEVDLRWGITEKQSQSSQAVGICLREVSKADLFIGLVGERYGWVPDDYNVSDSTGLEWLKTLKPGLSITELEMRGFKQKTSSTFRKKAMFYFRDESFIRDVPKTFTEDFTSENEENAEKLGKLKGWIWKNGAEIYKSYPCHWGGVVGDKPIVSGLEQFGQRVLNNLWNAIKLNYISTKSSESDENTVDSSESTHGLPAVNLQMAKNYIGGKKLLDKVLEYLAEAKNKIGKNLLLVAGKSGSGKSAFMSKIMLIIGEKKSMDHSYFMDAGSGNQSLISFVKCLFETLNCSFGAGYAIPETYSELKMKFEELLKFVSKNLFGEPCMIFVDSLDKVDVGVLSSLTDWIPEVIPKGVYFVISCTENTNCHKVLSSHKQLMDVVKIGSMELSDRAIFVRHLLANYGKALDESPFNNQMKLLLSKKDSASPLYLQLACEELRMFGVYENFSQHIKKLSQTVPQIIEWTLQRMEAENGEHLIRDTLALLYVSRQGLNKEELFDTLNMMQNFNNTSMEKVGYNCFHDTNFVQQQIPLTYFLKICQSIKVFLNDKTEDGVMKVVYKDILKIVEKRYIMPGGSEYMSKLHIVLAGLHKRQADPGNNLKWSGNDRKALIELPYHLTVSAIGWKDLQALLCSIDFIKAKVEGNMCTQLLEDFQADIYTHSRQIQTERNKVLNNPDVLKTKEFLSENIHILSKYPMLLLQQAINAPNDSYIHKCAESFSEEELRNVVAWLNKSSTQSTCSLTITQQQPLLCVCLSKDETMIACGMEDGQLILYDKNTTKELKSFVGHGSSITSCCFIGTDKLCSASDDGSISIWDISGGHRLHVLDKHTRQVSCCISTDDGKLIVSSSLDNTAKLWNSGDGSVAGELTGFIHPFNCVALDVQQKYAALGSWNRNIVIWNILENIKTAVYKGHSSSVRALAYAPSGRHLVSASLNGEMLLWATANGSMVGQLSSGSFPMTSLCYSPSGSQLIAASTNGSIRVWSGSLGAPGVTYAPDDAKEHTDYALCVAVQTEFIAVGYNTGKVVLFQKNTVLNQWKAHTSSIRSLSFISQDTSKPNSANVKHLVTASDDCTVKRWSLGSKIKCLYTMKGHTHPVKCVRSKEAYVISGSEDCTLHVWPGLIFVLDSEDNMLPASVLRGHTGAITCCDISSCETMAMSGSTDKSLIIWDLNKKTALCTVNQAHADGLTACCWSDVGNFIVTGSNDFMLKLWDAKFLIANSKNHDQLKEKVKFLGHTGTINDVKYKYGCITSACTDGSVKVWTHKGIEITTFSPHEKRINGCDIWTPSLENELFSSNWADVVHEKSIQQKVKATKRAAMNDVLVYTASDDGTVASYRPFKPFLINELHGHADVVSDVLVSKKQAEVISCSFDKTIKTWERKLWSEKGNIATHSGEVSCLAVHADGELTLSGGYDGFICIHSVNNGITKASFACSNYALNAGAFISKKFIVVGDAMGTIGVWDIQKENMVESVTLDDAIQSISVGGVDACYVAVSSYSQFVIYRWDASRLSLGLIIESLKPTSEHLHSFHVEEKQRYLFEYPMTSMVFLKASNQLLSADNFNDFHCFDVKKLSPECAVSVRTIPKMEYQKNAKSKRTEIDSASSSIAYGVNRSTLRVFIGNTNGTISFNQVNLYTGQLDDKFSSENFHDDYVTGIFYDDATNLLVTASKDCTVKVWKHGTSEDPFETIQQIGLFHCRAPVTKLVGICNEVLTLVVGDANGNVDFLQVKM